MKAILPPLIFGLAACALSGLTACGRHQSEERRPTSGSDDGPLLASDR